jgi:DNA-binding transcriptional LysR family regulator
VREQDRGLPERGERTPAAGERQGAVRFRDDLGRPRPSECDIALVILPEVLTQFARRYPEVRVDLRATNRHVDLVAEGFDLAIRAATKMKDSTLTARRLAIGGLGFYAAPSYVARRGRPKRIGDAEHDWIVHPLTRAALKLPPETVTRFMCDDFLVIRALARDGAGVGMMPRFIGTPYVNEGLLEDVRLAEPASLRAGLYLVWPSSGQVPRKVVAFREFFVEWLRKAPMG